LMSTIILMAGCCLQKSNASIPPGWQIIRPLDAILAMEIQGNALWAGGKDGVYKLDRQSGRIISKLDVNPPITYVKALAIDRSGILYIGHFNGLTTYDGNAYHTYTTRDGLPDDRVNALLVDSEGRLWVGTWEGLAVMDHGKWNIVTKENGLIDNMVNYIFQDMQGGMWFGSYVAPQGGVSYLNDGKWQHFSANNGLPHNNVTSIVQDTSGDIWIGTGLLDRGGAVRLAHMGQGWAIQQTLTRQHDGLAGDKVRSVFQDKDGVMWLGSEYDGVAYRHEGKWHVLTDKDGLSNNEVTCMMQDIDSNLWLGTFDGITRLSYDALRALE
jgi:ligand-binding sensor domain-containing protein